MISGSAFEKLRLRDFTSHEQVSDLESWEYEGRLWLGEAVGFTEWLRPMERPDSLGSVALDLMDLPHDVSAAMLKALGLPLLPGMSLDETVKVLGKPNSQAQFTPDRSTHCFAIDGYSVECTIHSQDGLVYLTILCK